MNRTIITVIGKDRVGIIATVCTYLAEHKINILDIDQSIIQGYFHMMMIVDANGADKEFRAVFCCAGGIADFALCPKKWDIP